MLISFLWLIIGGLLLYLGAEWMVRGGSNLAGRMGVSPLVIGLTVVAFGTSLPELMVSLVAVIGGRESIAIGNVIGSNIANVGLVLGVSSLIFPISVAYLTIAREIKIYLAVMAVFVLVCADLIITRWEGALLFLFLISYTVMHIKHPPLDYEKPRSDHSTVPRSLLLVILGIALLTYGADLFVKGAVELATLLGIPEVVIGMTIVALGTSLPELATSVVAAFRRESGISIGNIIGSNLFNILSVIGVVSMVRPMRVEGHVLSLELPLMIAFGIVLFPIARMRQPIPRTSALILLLGYLGVMVWMFYS